MIRKIGFVLLLSSFLFASSFAQQPDTSGMPGRGPHMQCPRGQGMGMGPCSMLMRPQVYPAQDGGFLVVVGNRLVKFDKNLSKKQTVTVELSQEEMQQMMNQMRQMMQSCSQMMNEMFQDTTSGGQ